MATAFRCGNAGRIGGSRLSLDSPAMTDDGGVLENLPRSRLGKRSEKRAAPGPGKAPRRTAGPTRPAQAAAEAAEQAERGATAAAEPAPGAAKRAPRAAEAAPTKPRPAPGAGPRRGARRPERPSAERSHPDPVGGLIRGAAKAAGAGVRVTGAVAHEVFRRLPRP